MAARSVQSVSHVELKNTQSSMYTHFSWSEVDLVCVVGRPPVRSGQWPGSDENLSSKLRAHSSEKPNMGL